MTYKYTKTETVDNATITEEWVVDTFEELVKISSPQVGINNKVSFDPAWLEAIKKKDKEEREVTPKTLQDIWE